MTHGSPSRSDREALAATDREDSSSATDRLTVSVVICAYDARRWQALRVAVDSLARQSRPPDEIVVVIDHNPELFARAQAELDGVVVIENEQAQGLSGGRNAGIAASSGAIVAFLDDDAEAGPEWLRRLAGLCHLSDSLGAGGRALPRWLAPRPRWFPDEFLWVVGCTYRGVPETVMPVRNLFGSCFGVRREVLAEIGGFRTELGRVGTNGMGCEETDLCIRAGQASPEGAFFYDPDAVIQHDVPAGRTTWHYFRSRCYAEGISKARLAELVGRSAALSTERTYAARTLPAAVLRNLRLAVAEREPGRLLEAGVIVSGLAFTAAGYAVERSRRRWPFARRPLR